MSRLSNSLLLVANQYRDASNLNARIYLHDRFSTNKYSWHLWVFDHLKLPPESRILELGCGAGTLWLKNLDRIPEGWDVTLSDFSFGMLQEAWENLCSSHRPFRFAAVDAQAIPFKNESFDAVIANHMLYHVPDREKALTGIHRVLKPGGKFYAATNGPAHMRELRELAGKFDPDIAFYTEELPFNLENGLDQISRWFTGASLHRYEDSLVVTEVEPLVAYILSSNSNIGSILSQERTEELAGFIEKELISYGALYIAKESGLFEACSEVM